MKVRQVRRRFVTRAKAVQRLGVVVILGAIVAVGSSIHADLIAKEPSQPEGVIKEASSRQSKPRPQSSAIPGLHISSSNLAAAHTGTGSATLDTPALLPWTNGQWAVDEDTWYRDDGDIGWRNVTPPTLVASDAIVTACGFWSKDTGVIATRQNGLTTMYSTNDGGKTWTVADLTVPGAIVEQVDMVNTHIAYAYGESASRFFIWETVDSGQNWVTTISGASPLTTVNPWFADMPQAISFSSAAVGYRWSSPTSIAYTTDAGHSWSSNLPTLPPPDGTVALADVHWTELPQFFGNIGVWAIDATVANKAVCVIYRSDDGGLSWTPAAVERWNPSVILHFVTPQTGWAIAPDQNEWLTSDDGGKTWRPVVSSIRVTSLINIQPLSASQAYAVEILKSGSLRWIVTRDGGKSWGGVAYPFQGADTP